MNSFAQILPACALLQFLAQSAVANNFAIEIYSSFLQFRAGIDQNIEPLERDQSCHAEKSNFGGTCFCTSRDVQKHVPPRKAAEIDPVVNAKNLAARFRTTRREQITAIIGFGADKFCAGAEFAQQFVIAEIAHEILTMRRHAERNSADCFHEHGGVRGAIGEMDMKMGYPSTLEKLEKKQRVPRTQRRLVFGAVFFFMLRDQRHWPASFAFRFSGHRVKLA